MAGWFSMVKWKSGHARFEVLTTVWLKIPVFLHVGQVIPDISKDHSAFTGWSSLPELPDFEHEGTMATHIPEHWNRQLFCV